MQPTSHMLQVFAFALLIPCEQAVQGFQDLMNGVLCMSSTARMDTVQS